MYSGRWKTDLSYYDVRDTYSLPTVLRNARENFDLRGEINETGDDGEPDEDEQFLLTTRSCTGIFHLALRRLLHPFQRFIGKNRSPSNANDVESNVQQLQVAESSLLDCSEDNILLQYPFKTYEIEPEEGKPLEVFEFALEHKKNVFENYLSERGDLTSLVLSENCATLIWVWSEETRIVLLTESSKSGVKSLKQWYRKILSDIALTDSIIIGHPYYWHPVVRRRLSRAMKHFKKLHDILEKRESSKELTDAPWLIDSEPLLIPSSSTDSDLEYISPKDSTKVILSGQKEQMKPDLVNNLCLKWTEYSKSLQQHGVMDGDLDSGDVRREKLENFLASLTKKTGTPPENSISLSLGPYFRIESIGRNISTVSACLPNTEVPIHGKSRWKAANDAKPNKPLRPRNPKHSNY